MFRDIGTLEEPRHGDMREQALEWTRRVMDTGDYLGWFAHPVDEPDNIISGAGVLLREAPPTVTTAGTVRGGVQALVINVFTEPEWRHKGAARLLMVALLEECQRRDVMNVVLHAAPNGRHLYETLGFVPTTEMRLENR